MAQDFGQLFLSSSCDNFSSAMTPSASDMSSLCSRWINGKITSVIGIGTLERARTETERKLGEIVVERVWLRSYSIVNKTLCHQHQEEYIYTLGN